MELVTSILLAIVVASFVAVLIINLRSGDASKRLPPGPKGLPIIGSLLEIPERDYLKFIEYSRQFGEIVYLRIGPMKFVLLNSVRAMKEALVNQANIFSYRQHSEYMDKLFDDSGLVFTDGPIWRLHRRANVRFMRELGAGKEATERAAMDEAADLTEHLKTGSPIDIAPVFFRSVTNVIAQFTFGRRVAAEDANFAEFQQRLDAVNQDKSFTAMLPMIFPFLMRVPFFMTVFEYFIGFEGLMRDVNSFIRTQMKQHVAILQENNVPLEEQEASDVLEALLIEQAKQKKENKADAFTDIQIIRDVGDLFLAGADTTSMTLTWATFLLACNPDVQERLHAEIIEVVGKERLPSMKDRLELHYTNAVIDEVLRYATMGPTGLPHSNSEDTELLGYFIPKGSVVITFMWAIHRDPELWKKPEEFYPEHFLTPEGRYQPSDSMVIFSMGPRACLGEGFARMETFLFLASVIQKFSVCLADPNLDKEKVMLGRGGGTRRLLPYEVIFTRR